MKDERGIASLTGILILMMLAYLIRGTIFTAETYVDMTGNFHVENKLQLDAQSKFDAILPHYEGKSFTDEELTAQIFADNQIDGVEVQVSTIKYKGSNKQIIKILTVNKKINHFGTGINAYRSICGFLAPNNNSIYEFGGFLYDNLTLK